MCVACLGQACLGCRIACYRCQQMQYAHPAARTGAPHSRSPARPKTGLFGCISKQSWLGEVLSSCSTAGTIPCCAGTSLWPLHQTAGTHFWESQGSHLHSFSLARQVAQGSPYPKHLLSNCTQRAFPSFPATASTTIDRGAAARDTQPHREPEPARGSGCGSTFSSLQQDSGPLHTFSSSAQWRTPPAAGGPEWAMRGS
jgi:hypothetical protein